MGGLPEDSSLTKSKQILAGIKQRRLGFDLQGFKAIVKDSPSLFRTAEWQWLKKQKSWPANASLQMNMWVEQLPQWQNRLCLSEQKDPCNFPS